METALVIISAIFAVCTLFFFLWRLDTMPLSNCKKFKSYTIEVCSHELYKALATLPDKCKLLNPFVQCKIVFENGTGGFKDISNHNADVFVFCKTDFGACDYPNNKHRNIKIANLDDTYFVAYSLRHNGHANDWLLSLVFGALNSHFKNNESMV